jgi:hypothetical protein
MNLYFLLQLYWYGSRLEENEIVYPLDIPFFWKSAWEILAELKSLQSLRVEFTDGRVDNEYPPQDGVVHLLKPMTAVKFPKYVVQFDWAVEVDELERLLGGDLPFEVQVKEKPVEPDYYW